MDAYIGEIRLMPFNFAPQNWMQCLGQTLAISTNTALFSILGVNYGGNGTTTFQLPNFGGITAIGAGSGGGLSPYTVGETAGAPTETLTQGQLPMHVHSASGTLKVAEGSSTPDPTGGYLAGATTEQYGETVADGQLMAPKSVTGGPTTAAGGGQAHDNMMPFLVLNYCICTQGIYPQRP